MSDILVLASSNNKNLELANTFKDKINEQNVSVELIDLTTIDLPLYTPARHKEGAPDIIHDYIKKLDQAKGLVITAPEYNGGIPPVLTNFIAWISTSGDKDWRKCFNGKHVAIGSFSGSGGLHLLTELRMQLSYLGMNVIGRHIQAHFKKPVNEESVEGIVSQLIKHSL
jgi:chromate reductase